MRSVFIVLVSFFLLAVAGRGETPAVSNKPVIIRPTEVNNLLLARGVFTSIRFLGNKKIEGLRQGSEIFSAKIDEDSGQRIDLIANPRYASGATNMIVTIGGVDYVFVVQITPDVSKVVYTRTYALSGEEEEEVVSELSRLGGAPKLRPSEIDIAALVRMVERSRIDPVYRKTLRDYRQSSIRAVYSWNNCIVHLMEVNAFLAKDLLLFKVEWVNTTGFGIYLNARQLGLSVSGHAMRIVTSMQNSPDSWVLPGQMDTLWLVVQGERAAYLNPWVLTFPPGQAEAHNR